MVVASIWLVTFDALAGPVCLGKVHSPRISVKLDQSRVHYDNNLSSAQIEGVKRQHGYPSLPGHQTIGLTSYSLGFATRLSFTQVPASNGQVCIFVTQAVITVFNEYLDVYVDKRYRRGSCQYDVIIRHEEEHVRMSRDFMRDYRTGLRKALTPAIQRLSPMLANSTSQKSLIMDRLQKLIEPVRAAYEAELDQRNNEIDTPESYRRTAAQCPSW